MNYSERLGFSRITLLLFPNGFFCAIYKILQKFAQICNVNPANDFQEVKMNRGGSISQIMWLYRFTKL